MSTQLYPLASLTQIEKTPSREDGIPAELEEDLRAYGCKLIQQAGILLKQYVAANLTIFDLLLIFSQKSGCDGHRADIISEILLCLVIEAFWYRSKWLVRIEPSPILKILRTLAWARYISHLNLKNVPLECAI